MDCYASTWLEVGCLEEGEDYPRNNPSQTMMDNNLLTLMYVFIFCCLNIAGYQRILHIAASVQ